MKTIESRKSKVKSPNNRKRPLLMQPRFLALSLRLRLLSLALRRGR